MRLRVFVSSVMEDFQEYRQAAKAGIISAGAEAVLVEDYPSLSVSPRNACLDGVASCDIYLAIVGQRGGWTAPSGNLVVEEEYEEAGRRKVRVIAFMQNVEHDKGSQFFVDKLSHYVDGVFRVTFNSSDELKSAIKNALLPLIPKYGAPYIDMAIFDDKLKNPYKIYNQAALRFMITPERVDEMIDPISLESPALERQLNEIAHSAKVEIFSYRRGHYSEVGIDSIALLPIDERGYRDVADEVRIEVTTNGMIIIDTNVTGRAMGGGYDFADSMTISEEEITACLKRCFLFAAAFYDMKDPFKRYDRFFYNSALSETGSRKLVPKMQKSNSFSIGTRHEEIVIAFDRPKLITRAEFVTLDEEVKATITLFRRRLK
jgi:Domain of unknown function (DUF4062)